MLDTESLIGGTTTLPAQPVPLYYPPPMAQRRRLRQASGPLYAPLSSEEGASIAPAIPGLAQHLAQEAAQAQQAAAQAQAAQALAQAPAPSAAPPSVPAAAQPVAVQAAAPAAAQAAPSGGAKYAGTPVPSASELSPAAQAAAEAAELAAQADVGADGYTPPPVDEVQWEWLQGQLNSSTADWIVVVGYHPIWSAGAWGPTWPLVTRLLPLLEAAGVALYVAGCDQLMQHFNPVPVFTNLDFIVIGNGAYAQPAGTTAAEAMPHALDCPDKALQFSFGQSSGFASLQISSATAKQLSMLHVNFFDANATNLYGFEKENPRTMPGRTAGNLKAPPAPGHGAAQSTYDAKPLEEAGGAFMVVAVLLCLIGAAGHARRRLMQGSAMRARAVRAAATTEEEEPSEITPLMLRGSINKPVLAARRYQGL